MHRAPPRAPPTRTTEEQEAEQALRRRILNQASERLINILSPHPFTSAPPPSSSPSQLSPSPSSSAASASLSSSSSPTLTSQSAHRHRTRHRSRSTKRRSNLSGTKSPRVEGSEETENGATTWRPRTNDPIAPVRVVHLGKNWEVLNENGNGEMDPMVTPSTMRRQQKRNGGARLGGGGGKGRPPSSHSMRTLPSRGGGSAQPSPLRGHSSLVDGEEHGHEEREEEEDDGNESEDRFETATSYRTAASGSRGIGMGSRIGLRDIWGTAMGGDEEAEEEIDPRKREELEKALRELEDSIDDFRIKPVGPLVADLAEHNPKPAK
ncbi:uncharacterized protein JCM6883_006378 [Sporobolomyces salmoneus]|uniref:uncharacterized protein n=1 Tax=Sporobolomyces salmoneus TaxID=183962 RepID=UPI00317403DA